MFLTRTCCKKIMGIDKCLTLNPENSLHIHRLKYGMGRPKVAVVAKRRLKALNAAKIDTASLDSRLLAMFSDVVVSTKCHYRRPTANPKEIQTLEIPRFNQDLRLGANLAQEALNLRDVPFQASGILSLDPRVCCASPLERDHLTKASFFRLLHKFCNCTSAG